jgi:hypothetical protein
MKAKKNTFRMIVALVGVLLLLGVSVVAEAQVRFGTVIMDKAIGIDNLNVNGILYNVIFDEQTPALGVYGALPGTFDFTSGPSASDAVDAVIAALNAENARIVGEDTQLDNIFSESFKVGWNSTGTTSLASVDVFQGFYALDTWTNDGSAELLYSGDERTYATFAVVPEPVSSALFVVGAATLGFRRFRKKTSK